MPLLLVGYGVTCFIAQRAVLVAPARVVRQSSDLLAVRDPEVSAALRLIRQNAHRRLRVSDILKHIPLSRAAFERRFRGALGRSPLSEINRVHLERAKELLASGDLPLAQVARASGYRYPSRLGEAVRRDTGLSPRAHRRQARHAVAGMD